MEYLILFALVSIMIVLLKEKGFFSGKQGYICEACDLMIMENWSEEKKCYLCNNKMTQIKGYF